MKSITNRRLALALGGLFIALAAIRIPQLARPSLDGSWSLALSVGHEMHLLFGRDVAFTFGPLGYLIGGAVLPSTIVHVALWSASIALLFAAAVVAAVATRPTALAGIALATVFGLIAASTIGEDYLFLFAFLAALGTSWWFAPRRLLPTALVLGMLAGLAAMTKFTLAIDCGGAAVLYFIGTIALASAERRVAWYRAALAFATGFFALILATFSPGTPQTTVAVLVLASAAWACSLRGRPGAIVALAGSLAAFGALFLLAPGVFAFVRVSLSIASDYSSAMSYEGPEAHTIVALALIALIAVPIGALFFERNAGLGAALAFALFGGFKHGFVRQDIFHVLYFATTAAAVAAVASFAVTDVRARRAALLAVAASTIGLASVSQYVLHVNILSGITPATLAQKIAFLATVPVERGRLAADNASALSPDRLTPDAIAKLGNAPVDIEPSEATIALASGLHWSPVPSLQAYAAYDRTVDDLNVASILNRPPGYVLFSWSALDARDAVDGRYPFGDSPQMMANLACRYRISGPAVRTAGGTTENALAGPANDRCASTPVTINHRLQFGQIVIIDHDPRDPTTFTTIAIETRYSLLGRLRKSFFRIGYLYLTIYYDDKTTHVYRIVPEAAALGMIIEPSPRSPDDARSFFATTMLPNVEGISVSTDEPSSFGSDIGIVITNRHRAP